MKKVLILSHGHFTHEPHCPECGRVLDSFTHVGDSVATPKPGDCLSVCAYCGVILELNAQEHWMRARPETILKVERSSPEKFQLLMLYLMQFSGRRTTA